MRSSNNGWLLAAIILAVISIGAASKIKLPPMPPKRFKPIARASAGQLMSKGGGTAAVDPPTTNIVWFRYPTNAQAVFGWEIQTSDDLKTWRTFIYPVTEDMGDPITVYATNAHAYYRVVGRN